MNWSGIQRVCPPKHICIERGLFLELNIYSDTPSLDLETNKTQIKNVKNLTLNTDKLTQ